MATAIPHSVLAQEKSPERSKIPRAICISNLTRANEMGSRGPFPQANPSTTFCMHEQPSTCANVLSSSFSHPDCTVGSGLAPDPALCRETLAREARGLTRFRDHRRSGISPCPEGIVKFLRAYYTVPVFRLTIAAAERSRLSPVTNRLLCICARPGSIP
jgi:hypothetical protein